MFVQHLKYILRHLGGNLLYSAINIIGLSVGLMVCLLILLYVRYETSYDTQWTNADHIYRISREYYPTEGARLRIPASNNAPVAPALLEDFPAQVEAATRIFYGGMLLEREEQSFEEPGVRLADASFFDVFDPPWIAGDRATALLQPGSIVLTESLARKYFGTVDVVGQTLRVLQRLDARVTGVMADLPSASHLDITGLLSMSTATVAFGPRLLEQWNSSTDFHTYLRLRSPEAAAELAAQLPDFLARHAGEEAAQGSGLVLMPITDIHLHSDRDEEWLPTGDIGTVRVFAGIAFAILVIACINFMSIATARATRRAREVGMRKALGATRGQLIVQFLGESAATVLLALLGALALVQWLQPAFAGLTGIAVTEGSILDTDTMTAGALLLVFVSVMAGSWPAFFLSSFQPASVLRGGARLHSARLRDMLVVLQFAIAIALVVATLVMQAQRQFIREFDIGFDKDQVVVLRSPELRGYGTEWPAFKEALLAHPAIENVTASHYLPFGFNDNQVPVRVRGTSVETRIQVMVVDFDFFETYRIPMAAGRSYSPELEGASVESEDQGRVYPILNRSAARALGLEPEQAIQNVIEISGSPLNGQVMGVTDDIYFETMRLGERPLVFLLGPPQAPEPLFAIRDASIRVAAGALPQALAHIDATWKAFNPDASVNRHFLEEDFQALYQADQRQGELMTAFATIAIAIACFGLFGLASFNAERRTREIGVRKVMGGSVWSIVLLLTNDFSKLVLVANVIAWPIAYVAMDRWLESFIYRIDLTPVLFVGSGAIALCIAWVTVAGTAAKAASARPVLALRYE